MKDTDFRKLTKKQKLEMKPDYSMGRIEDLKRVLLIPIKRKMSGYGMSAIFVETKDGWKRVPDYDCFNFTFWQPKQIVTLRGDFEYGGVVFFMADHTAASSHFYGGSFDIG
jgi:hypothetical protein